MKSIYIIGTGMNGSNTLTAEAGCAIRDADVLIGAKRIVKPFEHYGKPELIAHDTDEILKFIKECKHERIAVLMSGDCGFHSGAEKLVTVLGEYGTEIISGIPSLVYFCGKLKKPWAGVKAISLHGVHGNVAKNAAVNRNCFFLLGGKISAGDVCKRLCEYGLSEIGVYIGERLAYESERITQGKAGDFTELETDNLSVLLTENPRFCSCIRSGIPDDEFIRGDVPMTKSEVRSIAVSKLGIGRDSICWDIGCGSGSVSVEMAVRCYDGMVYSVDKNIAAVNLAKENSRRFCCDNIQASTGEAPHCLSCLPAPGSVFIGGSCGKIGEILSVVYEKNREAIVVITAVSLETLNNAITALKSFEINPEIIQAAITRAKSINGYTMLTAENPVFIIRGKQT
jgi:precorrin-6Y C5,15-methyltransferase (decarboxylating)